MCYGINCNSSYQNPSIKPGAHFCNDGNECCCCTCVHCKNNEKERVPPASKCLELPTCPNKLTKVETNPARQCNDQERSSTVTPYSNTAWFNFVSRHLSQAYSIIPFKTSHGLHGGGLWSTNLRPERGYTTRRRLYVWRRVRATFRVQFTAIDQINILGSCYSLCSCSCACSYVATNVWAITPVEV